MNHEQLKRKIKGIIEDEWCKSEEIVYEDKKTRCSLCGRRLKPREAETGIHFQLPPHKKKGYKIRRKKGHNKRYEKKGRYCGI